MCPYGLSYVSIRFTMIFRMYPYDLQRCDIPQFFKGTVFIILNICFDLWLRNKAWLRNNKCIRQIITECTFGTCATTQTEQSKNQGDNRRNKACNLLIIIFQRFIYRRCSRPRASSTSSCTCIKLLCSTTCTGVVTSIVRLSQ